MNPTGEEVNMKRAARVAVALIVVVAPCVAQESGLRELTDAEIIARIKTLEPRSTDFVYTHPAGWSANLAAAAAVVGVLPGDAAKAAAAAIDGDDYSAWVAPLGESAPELTIDMGAPRSFDRLVVFARHTDARGTGGGNNALRKLGISVSSDTREPFQELGEYAIDGPAGMCLKRIGGGQVCFFVDRKEPTILALPRATGRFLRLRLLEAHWGEYALAEWRTSVAVSEFMVFKSGGQ
jgi:hypothetical protein